MFKYKSYVTTDDVSYTLFLPTTLPCPGTGGNSDIGRADTAGYRLTDDISSSICEPISGELRYHLVRRSYQNR